MTNKNLILTIDMKLLLITFFLYITGCIYGQYTLEAVVLDGITHKPVVNANVYLDGTTKGTTTDLQGRFKITVKEVINTSLVISFIGYEKVVIQSPFLSLPKTIYLEESEEKIPEVVVRAKIDKTKRNEMLRVFRNHFLGHHVGSCRILNEDDIILTHDTKNNELTATSKKTLLIVNNFLKYYVRYDLKEFKIKLLYGPLSEKNNNSPYFGPLNKDHMKSKEERKSTSAYAINPIFYRGTVSFKDIGNGTGELNKRRKKTYDHSFRCFFHLLSNESIKSGYRNNEDEINKFRLVTTHFFNIGFYNQEDVFLVSTSADYPSMKFIEILPQKKQPVSSTIHGDTTGIVIDVRCNNGELSSIAFLTESFQIDQYGNTDLQKNYFFGGAFGNQRVGDLLPLDYMPGQTENVSSSLMKEEVPVTATERVSYYIEQQAMAFPLEKIHVHTDKTNYIAGETLRFRAYLINYDTNTISVIH